MGQTLYAHLDKISLRTPTFLSGSFSVLLASMCIGRPRCSIRTGLLTVWCDSGLLNAISLQHGGQTLGRAL
ncbi:hypothetical protein JCM13664_21880 [Methylothermus subterraneus]